MIRSRTVARDGIVILTILIPILVLAWMVPDGGWAKFVGYFLFAVCLFGGIAFGVFFWRRRQQKSSTTSSRSGPPFWWRPAGWDRRVPVPIVAMIGAAIAGVFTLGVLTLCASTAYDHGLLWVPKWLGKSFWTPEPGHHWMGVVILFFLIFMPMALKSIIWHGWKKIQGNTKMEVLLKSEIYATTFLIPRRRLLRNIGVVILAATMAFATPVGKEWSLKAFDAAVAFLSFFLK